MTLTEHPIGVQVEKFPGMPGTAVRLLALVDDSGVSVPQIESILRQDAGLTANLLRLANSAYFGSEKAEEVMRHA